MPVPRRLTMYVVSKVVRHICVPASDALGFTPYLAAKHLHGSAKQDQISAMYHTEEAKVESLSLHSVHCDAPQPMQQIGCKLLRARTYAPSTTSSPNFLRSDSQNSMASSSTSPPGVSGWRIALSTAISTLRESNTYCEQGAIM